MLSATRKGSSLEPPDGKTTPDPVELIDPPQPVAADEAARIQAVYGGYQHSARKRESWSADKPGNLLVLESFHASVRRLLADHDLLPLVGKKVLEVGCGTGTNLELFRSLGAAPTDLFGIDILPAQIDRARAEHPGMRFVTGDAQNLPYETAAFDLVLTSVVFSSILDDGPSRQVASEMTRVLRPGGSVVWYDVRLPNPNNPNVRRISREDIARLFNGYQLDLRTSTLIPPLARRLRGPFLRLYRPLERIPLLRSHYVGLLTRRAGSDPS